MSEKTEEPTPRRLERARTEGDVAVSQVLAQASGGLVAAALVPGALLMLASLVTGELERAVRGGSELAEPSRLALAVLVPTVPLLAAVGLAGGVASALQAGGVVSVKKLVPRLDALDPVQGLGRLLSRERAGLLLRALLGGAAALWLAVDLLEAHAADVTASLGDPVAAAALAGRLAGTLAWRAALLALGLGLLDYLLVRGAWKRRLRMSKDEVRREHKEQEGDPEIKAARDRAHRELLAGATLSAVRDATVLVVNPTHLATALRYLEADDAAPRVLAQGEGDLAQRMVALARSLGIPVVVDVPLARALHELETGEEIPEALYEAVAAVLQEAWDAESDAQPSAQQRKPVE